MFFMIKRLSAEVYDATILHIKIQQRVQRI